MCRTAWGCFFTAFTMIRSIFFLFQLFKTVQSEDCKPCTCAWRSQKFQFVPCQVSLAMVAISNKKVLHDMKNRRYFFFEFSPRCRGAYEAPRGEKITQGDPTETEMSNLCVCLLWRFLDTFCYGPMSRTPFEIMNWPDDALMPFILQPREERVRME